MARVHLNNKEPRRAFFFVCLLSLIRIKYCIKCLLSAEAILIRIKYDKYFSNAYFQQKLNYFQYIVSSGRKDALRKTAYLPHRTCVDASLVHQIKAYIHPSHFWTWCQISSMHSLTRKTPQKRTLKLSLRHLLVYHSAIHWSTWKTYEFLRHRCCVALNFRDNGNHLLSHRFNPLMEPCVPQSTSAECKL